MKQLLAGLICLCLTAPAMAEEIHVAAAISMKETLTDAATEFKAETGNDVQFAFGASGALTAQIKNSKNMDAFVSAADKQMNDLQAEKLIDVATRRVVATNELVLVVPADSANVPADFKALADATYRKIAV